MAAAPTAGWTEQVVVPGGRRQYACATPYGKITLSQEEYDKLAREHGGLAPADLADGLALPAELASAASAGAKKQS